jgi:hypothetical protein
MKREVAEEIIESMKVTDLALDRLTTALRAIGDEEEPERKRMLRFIANLIVDLHFHITLPTIKDYPELHPDFPDGSFRWTNYELVERVIKSSERK